MRLARIACLLGCLAGSAPASSTEVEETIRDAVHWLVANQREDGAWGSHQSGRAWSILANVPGSHDAFRIATTALCGCALIDSPYQPAEARASLRRALDYLLDHHAVKRPNGFELYNVWAFGYGLQFFGEWLLANPEDPINPRVRMACRTLIDKSSIYQTPRGGWTYLDFNAKTFRPSWTYMSFTTATVLVGLNRVKQAGIEVPGKLVDQALEAVARSRTPEGNFLYGFYHRYSPRADINQDKGSACRTPLCLYSLDLFGREVGVADYRKALDDLLVRHARFQRVAVRRPMPHESWYAISGYFYLYGHAYAAYVLEKLPPEDQDRLWPAMVEAVMHCHQPDGSFWDYPLYSYHKPYGTAFALIALSRVPPSASVKKN